MAVLLGNEKLIKIFEINVINKDLFYFVYLFHKQKSVIIKETKVYFIILENIKINLSIWNNVALIAQMFLNPQDTKVTMNYDITTFSPFSCLFFTAIVKMTRPSIFSIYYLKRLCKVSIKNRKENNKI